MSTPAQNETGAAGRQPLSRDELAEKLQNFQVGNSTVNVLPAYPLDLGDWRQLGRENVTFASLQSGSVDIEVLFKIAKTVLAKVGVSDHEKINRLTLPKTTLLMQGIGEFDDGTGEAMSGQNPT